MSLLLYTAQCAGQAQRTHTLWPLLLLIMREMLEALHHVGEEERRRGEGLVM